MNEYDDVNVKCIKEYFRKFSLPYILWSMMVKVKVCMAGVTLSEKGQVRKLIEQINSCGKCIR